MATTDQTTVRNPALAGGVRTNTWNWIKQNRWWALVTLLAIIGLIVFVRPGTEQASSGRFAGGVPTAVNIAKAEKGDVQVILNALGTVTPLQTVTVRTQINGQLQTLGFTEGQIVKKGDFLAEVDPRPYQAALEQAQGTLAKDQALLKNAQVDLARYRTLVAQDSIAHQQLDTQEALVRQYQGQVITDQAAVDNAKLNLEYCHIVSPVTGRVGLRQVDQGNYITPSDTNGIVVVTQLQPISVLFTLPEDNVIAVTGPTHAGEKLQATAMDRANTTKLATGVLTNIDNQIDTTTGTFRMRAQFDNTDEGLFPNQFVNIQLQVDTLHDQTVVPTAAIQRGAPGTFVYVVNPDSTVSVRPVKLSVTQGERQAIQSGLQPGDTVVTDGVDHLRDGAKVALPGSQPPTPGAGGKSGWRHKRQTGDAGQDAAPKGSDEKGAAGQEQGAQGQGTAGQGAAGQGAAGQGSEGQPGAGRQRRDNANGGATGGSQPGQ
jgi:multidrug efflux system membrane fusion protein